MLISRRSSACRLLEPPNRVITSGLLEKLISAFSCWQELLMVKIGCLLACDMVPAPRCQLESREVLVPEGFVCVLIPACSGTQ